MGECERVSYAEQRAQSRQISTLFYKKVLLEEAHSLHVSVQLEHKGDPLCLSFTRHQFKIYITTLFRHVEKLEPGQVWHFGLKRFVQHKNCVNYQEMQSGKPEGF